VQFNRADRSSVEINLAPLVDVIFLLVIFFAVSTTFLDSSGLKLDLPSSSSTAETVANDLTVLLGADGRLSFEGQIVEREELDRLLREALGQTADKIVILRADTHTEHGEVVQLMDLIRDAGATGLTVDAQPLSED
jgi:biopolymer transport protein ExbD